VKAVLRWTQVITFSMLVKGKKLLPRVLHLPHLQNLANKPNHQHLQPWEFRPALFVWRKMSGLHRAPPAKHCCAKSAARTTYANTSEPIDVYLLAKSCKSLVFFNQILIINVDLSFSGLMDIRSTVGKPLIMKVEHETVVASKELNKKRKRSRRATHKCQQEKTARKSHYSHD